jgi:hypothetical protein
VAVGSPNTLQNSFVGRPAARRAPQAFALRRRLSNTTNASIPDAN